MFFLLNLLFKGCKYKIFIFSSKQDENSLKSSKYEPFKNPNLESPLDNLNLVGPVAATCNNGQDTTGVGGKADVKKIDDLAQIVQSCDLLTEGEFLFHIFYTYVIICFEILDLGLVNFLIKCCL